MIQILILKMASVEGKWKWKVAMLEMKLKVIEQLEKNKSQKALAEQFDLTKSMISDVWKDREDTCLRVLIQSSLQNNTA